MAMQVTSEKSQEQHSSTLPNLSEQRGEDSRRRTVNIIHPNDNSSSSELKLESNSELEEFKLEFTQFAKLISRKLNEQDEKLDSISQGFREIKGRANYIDRNLDCTEEELGNLKKTNEEQKQRLGAIDSARQTVQIVTKIVTIVGGTVAVVAASVGAPPLVPAIAGGVATASAGIDQVFKTGETPDLTKIAQEYKKIVPENEKDKKDT